MDVASRRRLSIERSPTTREIRKIHSIRDARSSACYAEGCVVTPRTRDKNREPSWFGPGDIHGESDIDPAPPPHSPPTVRASDARSGFFKCR
ncbi:hypothetical protein PUN28_005343 [Cardiocondyla obscurior]|uniref:Uncharacterized protein n=1 Tax=Cardiocondyla obscurior TaxID=286306 RepID=A0AAW2GFF3_9HYME